MWNGGTDYGANAECPSWSGAHSLPPTSMGLKMYDVEEDARGRRCECTAFLARRFSLWRAGGFSRLLTALLFDAVCDRKAALQPFEEGFSGTDADVSIGYGLTGCARLAVPPTAVRT